MQVYKVCGDRGSTVVKVLCYKSEGRWLDPSWCQWIFIDITSWNPLGLSRPVMGLLYLYKVYTCSISVRSLAVFRRVCKIAKNDY